MGSPRRQSRERQPTASPELRHAEKELQNGATVGASFTGGKLRMTIELNEAASLALEELSRKTGRSKVDILREGLTLRKFASDLESRRMHLAYVDDEDVVHGRLLLVQ